MIRRLLSISLLAAAMPSPAWSAPAPRKVLGGLLIELKTAEGWTLKAKYLPSKEGRQTFVLLHGTGGRKEDWYYLTRGLAGWGYGYLALDFRGHGESTLSPGGQTMSWHKFPVTKTENEFANMSRDVDAAFAYLAAQGASEETVGVIGADVGSSIGLKYAAVHVKVPAVVMLSPGTHYQEVLTVNAIRAYKNRPILMIYSEADKNSARATPLLAALAKLASGEKNVTILTVAQEHGVKMLRRQLSLVGQIVDWIKSPVKVPEDAAASTAAFSTSTFRMPEPFPQPELKDAPESPDQPQ